MKVLKIAKIVRENDEIKVLYSDAYNSAYKTLSKLFCTTGNPNKAFYVEELGRARALSDLMAAKYSVDRKISADPRSQTGIENVTNLDSDSACLYISYGAQNILLWIRKPSRVVELRENAMDKKALVTEGAKHLDTFFDNLANSFRTFSIYLPRFAKIDLLTALNRHQIPLRKTTSPV